MSAERFPMTVGHASASQMHSSYWPVLIVLGVSPDKVRPGERQVVVMDREDYTALVDRAKPVPTPGEQRARNVSAWGDALHASLAEVMRAQRALAAFERAARDLPDAADFA